MSINELPSGRWRLQIRRKKLQHDQLYDSKEEAERVQAELLQQRKRLDEDAGVTLSQLNEKYQASYDFTRKAVETQRTERSRIKAVLDRFGHYTVEELGANTDEIYEYIDFRLTQKSPRTGKKIGATSVRLEIAALSALVAYAKKRNYIRENFVSRIERPVTKSRKRRVNNNEQGRLTLEARNTDPAIGQAARFQILLRHTGCRPGELVKLKVDSIRVNKSELTFFDTKNSSDRTIHLTSDALTILNLQLQARNDENDFLFQTWSPRKKAWVAYNYTGGVTLLRKVGIVDATFHSHAGRREFVSRGIEAGVSLLTLKKQTGHKSTQALEIYDQGLSTAPELRAQLDKLADNVKAENLLGTFEAMGLTPEQRALLLKTLKLDDGWKQPFPK